MNPSNPTSPLEAYRTWSTTPLTEPPKYSVVVPAYNEEWRIVPSIGAMALHMSSLGEPWELIVADDGSTDSTVELVQELGLVNLRLLVAEANGGKGSAVRRGMLEAQGEIVLFADADQSTPIEQFGSLLAEIDAGYDVVVGSRATAGADVANKSALRNLMSSGLQTVVQTVFKIPVADTQCGFKMFTADAADLLFKRQLIDEFSFDLEILFLAQKFGLTVKEVPVSWIDAPGSKVEPLKVAVEFIRDLGVIRNNWTQGRYQTDNHQRPERTEPSAHGSSDEQGFGRQAA